jgi:NADPH:quinone reductase-like Zn-dependent oxidoreductase
VLSRALTPQGVAAIVGGDGGGAWTGGFLRGMLRGPIRSLFSKKTFRMVLAAEGREDLAELTALVEAGALTPVVDRTFALPDAAAALNYLEQGHPAGKVVITI